MEQLEIERVLNVQPNVLKRMVVDWENYPAFLPGVQQVEFLEGRTVAKHREVDLKLFISLRSMTGTLQARFQYRNHGSEVEFQLLKGPFDLARGKLSAKASGDHMTIVKTQVEYLSKVPFVSKLIKEKLEMYLDAATIRLEAAGRKGFIGVGS